MLTLEAMNGRYDTTYYLNTSDASQSTFIVAEKCFSENYQSRGLPHLTRPNEQFADVQRLIEVAFCKFDKPVLPEEKNILEFVQSLKEDALFLEEATQVMGMLIYLGEKDSSKVTELIDTNDVKKSMAMVKTAFLEEFEKQNGKIKESVNHQYYSDIFDYQKSERTKKVLLIANILVTKDGWVNSALIPVITQHCLNDQDLYQKEVITVLNALYYACTNTSNIPFTEHFSDIDVPENQLSEISDVLRATIHVSLSEILTPKHCKIAILAALLTHDNEKIPPSLFSREILAERMDRFLIQLSFCIKHGKVTVSEKEIQFSWDLSKSLFDKKIKVRRTGTVSKVQEAYWGQSLVKWWYPPYQLGNIPSISRAYHMIGFGEPSSTDQAVIERLLKNTIAISKIVNLSEVLWEAAAYSVRPNTSEDAITLAYRRGVLGLLSETGCPLLLVWSKLIKKAEGVKVLETRYNRIQRCIESVFSSIIADKLEQHRMKQIYRIFFSNFKDNVRLYEGFNSLYDSKETVIDSAASFKSIIESSIKAAKDALLTTLHSDAEKEGYRQIFDKLQLRVIDSHQFSHQFAVAYDPRNSETKNSDQYPHNTPWNEFKEFELPTFFTAFDDTIAFKDPTNTRPKSIVKFVEQCISKLRKGIKGCEYMYPLHPTMKAMMDESRSVVDLLSDHLIQPGLEVSIGEISKERQLQFVEIVKQEFIPSVQYLNFDNKISILVKGSTIISMFCKSLLKIVIDCVELDDGDREKTSLSFTNLVIQQLLLTEQKKMILDHAIHLFPTNWSKKDSAVNHFVAFFNPLTNNIGLGTSDGHRIEVLDQYDMIESGYLHSLLGS